MTATIEDWDFPVERLSVPERRRRAAIVVDRLFARRRVEARGEGMLVTYHGHTTSPRVVLSWREAHEAGMRIIFRTPCGSLADYRAVCDEIGARHLRPTEASR